MNNLDILPLHRRGRFGKYHFSEDLARRLDIERVLRGHKLCVNRLAWNHDGTYLLSGSDDKRMLLHRFPVDDHLPLSIVTEHNANIFGVQFLPHSENRILISGGMDSMVQLHRLDCDPETKFRYPSAFRHESRRSTPDCIEIYPRTTNFRCHQERVKDVEVSEAMPNLFWSASEDGTVRQFDVRVDYSQANEEDLCNVLFQAKSQNGGRRIGFKGLDINPSRPHLMGVACDDSYIRIYDMRNLTLRSYDGPFVEPLLKLSLPHISMRTFFNNDVLELDTYGLHSTYVNFSSKGDKIVAMFHGDHAYSFDITSEGTAACTFVRPIPSMRMNDSHSSFGASSSNAPWNPKATLNESARRQREEALEHLNDDDYFKALWCWDEALAFEPNSAALYTHRAMTLLKRKCLGDVAFALKDCDQATALDPDYAEAYFVRAQAVHALGQSQTAHRLLRRFQRRFPDNGDIRSKKITELENRIKEAIGKLQRNRSASKRVREEEQNDDALVDGNHIQNESSSSTVVPGDTKINEYLFQFYGAEKEHCQGDRPSGFWWASEGGRRCLGRYVGPINLQTDIKECTFMGNNDSLVACGSDDGNVFIFNAETGQPVNVLHADENVANCVQCHPTTACLATSGIESVIRLWSPLKEENVLQKFVDDFVRDNQEWMDQGERPQFINDTQMINRLRMIIENYQVRDELDEEEEEGHHMNCRVV